VGNHEFPLTLRRFLLSLPSPGLDVLQEALLRTRAESFEFIVNAAAMDRNVPSPLEGTDIVIGLPRRGSSSLRDRAEVAGAYVWAGGVSFGEEGRFALGTGLRLEEGRSLNRRHETGFSRFSAS
jgi:hypothetical protein